jgi:hypothetical protein
VSRDISTLFVPQNNLKTQAPGREVSSPFIQFKRPDKLLSCQGALALRAPPLPA